MDGRTHQQIQKMSSPPSKPMMETVVVLNSWHFTEIRETGDKLARVIDGAVSMAERKFNIDIYCVVSDNASAMLQMGPLMQVWHKTCDSHNSNLLLKSLDGKFAESINKLLREFKTPRAQRKLTKGGGTRIMVACESRGCSYRDTFRCCRQNLHTMHQLVDEGIVELKEASCGLLKVTPLGAQLQVFILMFDPVCELVNKCQAFACTSAEAAELWLSLHIPVNDRKIENALDARPGKVLQPIALVANFLDPRYQEKKFAHVEEFNSKVTAVLTEELGEGEITGLQDYKKSKAKFAVLFKKKIHCPKAFGCLMKAYYPILSRLAQLLMNIPSSSASIERSFAH